MLMKARENELEKILRVAEAQEDLLKAKHLTELVNNVAALSEGKSQKDMVLQVVAELAALMRVKVAVQEALQQRKVQTYMNLANATQPVEDTTPAVKDDVIDFFVSFIKNRRRLLTEGSNHSRIVGEIGMLRRFNDLAWSIETLKQKGASVDKLPLIARLLENELDKALTLNQETQGNIYYADFLKEALQITEKMKVNS